jgi:Uma2 family endonuclease
MGTRAADYLEAIEHLPDGAMLVIPQSSWEEYDRLLEDLVGRPGVRVTYNRGRLEIMSPSPEPEEYKEFILRVVHVAAESLGLPLETRGSATWKRQSTQQGTEADTCFYIANAPRVLGKRHIDLESDPAPDVAVEIDITNESLSKFPIYAALGVVEIWRYDGTTARFYELFDGKYREIAESRFLRGLTAAALTDALARSKKDGQTTALAAFRQRFQSEG